MWHTYRNGNAIIKISDIDGTRKMFTMDDEFDFAFPVSMDLNLTQYCDAGCKFCYAECSKEGKHGDIMAAKFVDTLHPYTECALQVNDLSHPQLVPFLYKLKRRNIFANITVNQIHFERKQEAIRNLVNQELIYGLGISLRNPTDEFINNVSNYPNAVIHIINGIATEQDIKKLSNNGLKILILGYKDKGRGHDYLNAYSDDVNRNQAWLSEWIADNIGSDAFKAIAFDNLSLEQLNIKKVISDNQWEHFYQGDEGTCSMFVDLVDGTFGVSSLVPKSEMHPLMDTVEEMFTVVKGRE